MELDTSIKYQGLVDVKQVSNKKVTQITVHNSSTTEMSYIFARALLNQSTLKYIPTQLDVGTVENGVWSSMITAPRPLTGASYKLSNNRYTTSYDALVIQDHLKQEYSSTIELYGRLLTSSGTVLAQADLGTQVSAITPATSLQITWNLTLVDG